MTMTQLNDLTLNLKEYVTKTNEDQFNLFLFIQALASKDFIAEDINKIYLEKEVEYYEASQRGIQFKHSAIRYPYMRMQTLRRLAGIVYFELEQNEFTKTLTLIKKGVKPIWNYFKLESIFTIQSYFTFQKKGYSYDEESILFDIAMAKFISFHAPNLDLSISGSNVMKELIHLGEYNRVEDYFQFQLHLYHICIGNIAAPLSSPLDLKSLIEKISNKRLAQMIQELRKGANGHEGYIKYSLDNDKRYRAIIAKYFDINKELKNEWSKSISVKEQLRIEQLITDFLEVKAGNGVISEDELLDYCHSQDFLYQIFGEIVNLSHNQGVQLTELMKVNQFTKKTWESLLYMCVSISESLKLSEREQIILFIFVLYTQYIIEDYSQLEQVVTDGSHEGNLAKVNKLSKELAKMNREYEQEKAAFLAKESSYIQQIKDLETQVNSYQKQLTQNEDNNMVQELESEVVGLRKYIFTREEEVPSSIPLEEMIKVIAKKKIIIMGGHQNWQRKVNEVLPFVELVYVDLINRDFKIISGYDYVFVKTSVLSHGFYSKLMKTLGKEKHKLRYLSGKVNIEKTIEEIYSAIK
ncbi:hypothetical protein KDN24_25230 [Bacillus sp. Bva_UNVM-123]|uniref:hypothetical protein n=1 Tax=Bacillus sp. Bva_UNVM-123 TaxID=2829798 RepID=UPI00391FB80D